MQIKKISNPYVERKKHNEVFNATRMHLWLDILCNNDKGEKYILSEITTEQKMKYNNTVTSVVLLYSGKPLIQLSSGWWYYVLILIVMCRYSHWPLKQLSTVLFKNISGFRVHRFCMLTYEDNSRS